MKKRIVNSCLFLFSVIILAAVLCCGLYAAAQGETPTVSAIDSFVTAGGSFSVRIVINNNPGIAKAKFGITFDKDKLTLTKIEKGDCFEETVIPENINSPVTLSWENTKNKAYNDIFAILYFTAADNVSVGDTSEIGISYSNGDLQNINGENVSFSTINGTVKIVSGVPGDINGDGLINGKDILRIKKYLAGWDVAVDDTALDVNADTYVNAKDVQRLSKYITGWNVEIFYGTIAAHIHTFTNWTQENDEQHMGECSCGQKQLEVHSFEWEYANDEQHKGVCKCSYEKLENHYAAEDEYTEDDDGNINIVCIGCGHLFVFEKEPEVNSTILFDDEENVIAVIPYEDDEIITFGEDGTVSSNVPFDAQEENVTSINPPEKEGKRFTCWCTADGEQISQGTEINNLTSDFIAYAYYTQEYKITFINENEEALLDENNNPYSYSFAPDLEEVNDIVIYPDISIIEKEGYTAAWSITADELAEAQINSDIEIYPVYEKISYTVNFYDYDGTVLASEQVPYNTSTRLPVSATRWYCAANYDGSFTGKVLTGWIQKNAVVSVNTEDSYTGAITQNCDFEPVYENGCTEPKLVISDAGNSRVTLSVMIPQDYVVQALFFKINYNNSYIGAFTGHEFGYGSPFIKEKAADNEEALVINKNEKFIAFSYADTKEIQLNKNPGETVKIVDLSLNGNSGYSFKCPSEGLSECFTLSEDESEIVYQIKNSDGSKSKTMTANLSVVFPK